MTSDELITRARQRCSRHRGPTSGCRRQCFLAEMEEMLLRFGPRSQYGSYVRPVRGTPAAGENYDALIHRLRRVPARFSPLTAEC